MSRFTQKILPAAWYEVGGHGLQIDKAIHRPSKAHACNIGEGIHCHLACNQRL